jgi:hypothetical protein
MTIDPITTLIIASLVGVCVVHIHKSYNDKNNGAKKTIYTSEEDIYLADEEDGPIWF